MDGQTVHWIDALKDTSVEHVMSQMAYPERVEVRKGLFPGTAEGVDDSFVFVNLDMDLYTPTYEGLKFFWERLSPGGSYSYTTLGTGMESTERWRGSAGNSTRDIIC